MARVIAGLDAGRVRENAERIRAELGGAELLAAVKYVPLEELEVLARFEHRGDGISAGRMLDLREVARRLLSAAGVEEVEVSDLCTSCEDELFFSHRRDQGRTGRQAGLVWREADARGSEAQPNRAAVEAPHA